MLEKPDIANETIIACLRTHYGLNVAALTFLPIGADRHTAVYRADTATSTPYFVKLRSGDFDDTTLQVPKLLADQGVQYVIAPFITQTHQLWTELEGFKLAVFPFIEGRNGYEMKLGDAHWIGFGRALNAIHTATLPASITDRIPRERFSDYWRTIVKDFQRQALMTSFNDPVAAALARFLRHKSAEISRLVQRASDLAAVLLAHPQTFILCHADLHAGNILIDATDRLYIIDWDTLIMAPPERDLMYAGGGQFVNHRTPVEEENLFYQGYGETPVNPIGLAYYRYERIVQDIAAYCEQILLTDTGGKDRAKGLQQLTRQFEPNGVVAIAYQSEAILPPEYRSSS